MHYPTLQVNFTESYNNNKCALYNEDIYKNIVVKTIPLSYELLEHLGFLSFFFQFLYQAHELLPHQSTAFIISTGN